MRTRTATLALLALLGVGCSGSQQAEEVSLYEFGIDAADTHVAGASTLTVVNDGKFRHSLVVSTPDGAVIAATEALEAGDTTSLDVDLVPGEYVFTCRIVIAVPERGLVDHYAKGMEAAVTVAAQS